MINLSLPNLLKSVCFMEQRQNKIGRKLTKLMFVEDFLLVFLKRFTIVLFKSHFLLGAYRQND